MQPSSRDKPGNCQRVVGRTLLIVSLALCPVTLSGCGSDTEQKKPSPEKVKSFDEVIAEARCLSCHLPGNRVGGPTWKEVALKYKKEQTAVVEKNLENKIARGGAGAWGRVNMPPHPELSDAELKVMVRGILAADEGKGRSGSTTQKK